MSVSIAIPDTEVIASLKVFARSGSVSRYSKIGTPRSFSTPVLPVCTDYASSTPVLPVLGVADELDHRRDTARRVGPQRLAEPGQGEPPIPTFLENRVTGERAHEPEGGLRVGTDASCDVLGGGRTLAKRVEDAERRLRR